MEIYKTSDIKLDSKVLLKEEVLKPAEKKIKDSGVRRDFGTGAVRDIGTGKGRFDLTPLDVVGDLLDKWRDYDNKLKESDFMAWGGKVTSPKLVLNYINNFMETGNEDHIFSALIELSSMWAKTNNCLINMIFDFAKHTEEGCLKYSDKDPNGKIAPNMMRGIPLHCYIDSGTRHYLKHLAGYDDEPHDRATIWNYVMAIWAKRHTPELDDINYEVYAGKGLKKNG